MRLSLSEKHVKQALDVRLPQEELITLKPLPLFFLLIHSANGNLREAPRQGTAIILGVNLSYQSKNTELFHMWTTKLLVVPEDICLHL